MGLLKKTVFMKMAKTRDWLSFGGLEVKLLLVPVVFARHFKEIGQKGDSPAPILPPSVQSLFLSVRDSVRGFFNSPPVPYVPKMGFPEMD